MANTDYEAAVDPAVIPQRDLSKYTHIARFPDPASAGQAVERLRQQGLASEDVTLLGTEDDIVRPSRFMTEPDHKVVKSTLWGSIAGVVIGAVIGAIAGVVLVAIPPINSAFGHVHGWGYLVAAFLGAIVGITLGGMAFGIAYLDRSKTGVDTYGEQVSRGETLVGVRATGERARIVTEALRSNGAIEVQNELPPAMRRAM